jgi:hypothetical protein
MTRAVDSVALLEQSVAERRPPKYLGVVNIACQALGTVVVIGITHSHPDSLRLTLCVGYSLISFATAYHQIRRSFYFERLPRRLDKSATVTKLFRLATVIVGLTTIFVVSGGLYGAFASAGQPWKLFSDIFFPVMFLSNGLSDYLLDRLPLPPPWPETRIGMLWISMRSIFRAQKADAAQR